MTAGFPAAADALRRDRAAIAADALVAAVAADPELQLRFDDAGLRQLLHDSEVLIDRLAMCVASDDPRPMAEYAEWIGPIFRRRGVSLWDVVALCEGIRETATPRLGDEEAAAMGRALDAAVEVLRKNGRLGRRRAQAQRPAQVALSRRVTAAHRAPARATNPGRTTDRRQP